MSQANYERRIKQTMFDSFIIGLSVMFGLVLSNGINLYYLQLDGFGVAGIVTTTIVFVVSIVLGINRERRLRASLTQ